MDKDKMRDKAGWDGTGGEGGVWLANKKRAVGIGIERQCGCRCYCDVRPWTQHAPNR
jgi:hypothetical protein